MGDFLFTLHLLSLAQVIETQMRKMMELVRELFSGTADVYSQLVAAKGHVATKMAKCHSSVQRIRDTLGTLCASDSPKLLTQLQVRAELKQEADKYL